MKEQLTIVKIGGAIIEDQKAFPKFLDGFLRLEGKKVLVHGGGKIATHLAGSLGIEAKMVDGRRITNDEMIDVVIMTYGGLINKKVVAGLNAKGANSIGLTGADAKCILSTKRPVVNGVDYGWVGDIESVNVHFLTGLIDDNIIPVMAPLTFESQGHLLNTNADTIASEVAIAFSSKFDVTLNFIFDQKGVMEDLNDPDSLIHSIDLTTYQSLKEKRVITEGMIPKLENAFYTLEKGVSEVRLLNVAALFQLQNSDFNEYTIIH